MKHKAQIEVQMRSGPDKGQSLPDHSASESKIQNPKSKILLARNLYKTYRLGKVDVPVLKGASLEVREGEWVAILGASGSGKSTLLHLLGDLDRPDAGDGSIRFDGNVLDELSLYDRNVYRNQAVGFVFQFYHLLPELTVLQNAMLHALVRPSLRPMRYWVAVMGICAAIAAALGAWLWHVLRADSAMSWGYAAAAAGGGVIGAVAGAAAWTELRALVLRFSPHYRDMQARARQLLESFGLGHRLRHRPRELSGGERQRVAIARALVNAPKILLADEPTGNLDEKTGKEILDLIAQQHRQGLTIVMVTHDPAIAQRADRVVQLHDGRVAEV